VAEQMNKYIAEASGTFALVFAGCGAIVVNDLFGNLLGHVGVSMVFGLVVMAMIYSIGNISGAHINPAVTLGFFWAGRISLKQVAFYMLSQFGGALLAAFILKYMFSGHDTLGITAPAGSVLQSFSLEVILSFILMFVILNVSTGHMEKGIMAGVAVGGVIALEALMGGPVSGASMNPARSFGPALVSGQMADLWIYLVAPFVGTFLAFPVCRLIQGRSVSSAGNKNNG
jgi:aquaporin Z